MSFCIALSIALSRKQLKKNIAMSACTINVFRDGFVLFQTGAMENLNSTVQLVDRAIGRQVSPLVNLYVISAVCMTRRLKFP